MRFCSLVVACVVVTVVLVGACFQAEGANLDPARTSVTDSDPVAVFETTMGKIVCKLFPDVAPNTVANFASLCRDKFYDGLTFHRFEKRFPNVVQGGCPNGDGTGDPGYAIRAEFNTLKHVVGTLSMALGPTPDSGGSQFFFCYEEETSLNGRYTVFGHVIEGLEVVHAMSKLELDVNNKPPEPVVMKKVRVMSHGDYKKYSKSGVEPDYPKVVVEKLKRPDLKKVMAEKMEEFKKEVKKMALETSEPVKDDEQVGVIDTSMGTIVVKFYPDVAPKHVKNFSKLARKKFYDGLIFHRVISGFMLQGGCPEGTGSGGPGWTVDAEFSDLKHMPGTLAMARSNDPNSAGSQFYICLTREATAQLDGKYTIFGQTVLGMNVVKAIGKVKTRPGDRPIKDVKINKIRIMTFKEFKEAESGEKKTEQS